MVKYRRQYNSRARSRNDWTKSLCEWKDMMDFNLQMAYMAFKASDYKEFRNHYRQYKYIQKHVTSVVLKAFVRAVRG